MRYPFAIVLIPGPGPVSVTLDSARGEIAEGVPLVGLGLEPVEGRSGRATILPAADVLDAVETLAFARAGDRLREGALTARRTAFAARPEAVLGVAGYRLVDADGAEVRIAPAPLPPFEVHSLLLRPAVEASAVLVRSAAINQDALELIARPHGDAVVWGRLAARSGLVPSAEIAVDVRLDPARHGHAPGVRLDALMEFARSGELTADQPDGLALRRELLRRLYIEPEPTALPPLDLFEAFGGADRLTVADLQWALERQREALAAERVTWREGLVAPEDVTAGPTDIDLLDAQMIADELNHHIVVRDAEIVSLHAQLEQKEALLARLREFGPEGA